MNIAGRIKIYAAVAALASAIPAMPVAAEIYKTIDADGNVVYTDKRPNAAADPLKLRGISVVESPHQQEQVPERQSARRSNTAPVIQVTSVRTLKRMYRDFALVSPDAEQTFWGTDHSVPVRWSTDKALQAGMLVVLYVDGMPMAPTSSALTSLQGLERGEHKVRAELINGAGKTIAQTDVLSFHIKQQFRR